MDSNASAEDLLRLCVDGDDDAGGALHARYVQRLLDLASRQMSPNLLRRIEPDDIVQSVFRTFFRRIDQWRLHSDRAGTIWHLLVRITLNKIRSRGVHHNAQRRDVRTEVKFEMEDFHPALVAHEPTPVEAAALCEELEVTFAALDEAAAKTLQLAIQGYTASEIAAEVSCSLWTVRRVLDRIGHELEERIERDLDKN